MWDCFLGIRTRRHWNRTMHLKLNQARYVTLIPVLFTEGFCLLLVEGVNQGLDYFRKVVADALILLVV